MQVLSDNQVPMTIVVDNAVPMATVSRADQCAVYQAYDGGCWTSLLVRVVKLQGCPLDAVHHYLCTAPVAPSYPVCIWREKDYAEPYLVLGKLPEGRCPEWFPSELDKPCSSTSSEGQPDISEVDTSLLQIRNRKSKNNAMCVYNHDSFLTAQPPNSVDYNTYQLSFARSDHCLEVVKDESTLRGSLSLRGGKCVEPMSRNQTFSVQMLREVLQPWLELTINFSMSSTCTSDNWPRCQVSTACQGGAISSVSLLGSFSANHSCSSTPIKGGHESSCSLQSGQWHLRCPEGMLLSSFSYMASETFKYFCVEATALGSCQNVALSTDGLEVQCPEKTALQSLSIKQGLSKESFMQHETRQTRTEVRPKRLEPSAKAWTSEMRKEATLLGT